MALAAILLSGCSGTHRLVPRQTAPLETAITWLTPAYERDAATMARWRQAVGSPIVRRSPAAPLTGAADALTVVSWNVALGAGDVIALVRELQGATPQPIVLLLQEAFRSGDDIPKAPRDSAFAGFLGNSDRAREIDAVAEALGFALYYVPSMRNGAPGRHDEDRGNAILTNLQLEELAAVELPFERQRRVAVGARVSGLTSAGTPWTMRLGSVHLDNTGSVRRAWVGGEYGRARQARGLREAFRGEGPIVVGGDFNTWFGFADLAYRELAGQFPETRVSDTRRTFRGLLRLDHVFYRPGPGWKVTVRRAESSRGSDHHALITDIDF